MQKYQSITLYLQHVYWTTIFNILNELCINVHRSLYSHASNPHYSVNIVFELHNCNIRCFRFSVTDNHIYFVVSMIVIVIVIGLA